MNESIVVRAMQRGENLPPIVYFGIGIPSRAAIAPILDNEEECLVTLFRYGVLPFSRDMQCKVCAGSISNKLKKTSKYSFK
jgi:hypothetical protein